jgi:hypothetical protein
MSSTSSSPADAASKVKLRPVGVIPLALRLPAEHRTTVDLAGLQLTGV